MFPHKELEELKKELTTPKNIAIVPHRNPDGDAMGSTLALYHFLKKQNHQVTIIAPNEFPDFLQWLPSAENVVVFEKNFDNAKEIIKKSDLLFTLDFNALHRTGEQMGGYLEKYTRPMVMIDHHQKPESYAKYTFSDTNYGSTCEMIFDFIEALEQQETIDKTIATCIYTGIVTDSGSFRFPKTTSKTHKIVAFLLEKGINNTEIHNLLFDNSTINRLQILGVALQNLVLLPEYNTSYIHLSQEELDKYNHKKGDTEGIVNYGLSIRNIDFTAIFIENKEENLIKISFRSQGSFDVNTFARNHFDGGGHINAAGGKSLLSLEETISKFISILAHEKK